MPRRLSSRERISCDCREVETEGEEDGGELMARSEDSEKGKCNVVPIYDDVYCQVIEKRYRTP